MVVVVISYVRFMWAFIMQVGDRYIEKRRAGCRHLEDEESGDGVAKNGGAIAIGFDANNQSPHHLNVSASRVSGPPRRLASQLCPFPFSVP